MASPEDVFADLLRVEGKRSNITDPTNIHCDICYEEGIKSMGGYVLLEKKTCVSSALGRFTYACTRCHDTFTHATTEERTKLDKNLYQLKAERYKIGLDTDDETALDETKTFQENVITFKKEASRGGKRTSWKLKISNQKTDVGREDKNEQGSQEEPVQTFERMCKNCMMTMPSTLVKTCGKCHNAYYCSKKCQKEDWKDHKMHCWSSK